MSSPMSKSLTQSEENYLKAIYSLEERHIGAISTNDLAEVMDTKASSVTDMIKRLSEKELVSYKKYQGCLLTDKGRQKALLTIRKHRLWEVFLVDKLEFRWDEVHDIAEELEHIDSDELINRLEDFLGRPKFDPHGDPIPTREGQIERREQVPLTELKTNETGYVTGVKDSSKEFLQYLDTQGIELGNKLEVTDIFDYDKSRTVKYQGKLVTLSQQVCKNLFVRTES